MSVVNAPEIQATYADSYNSTTNRGTGTTCTQNGSNSWRYRTFLQFDLSGVPAGALIISAILKFYVHSWNDNGDDGTYNIGRVTESWDETVLTWANQPAIAGEYLDSWEYAPAVNSWGSWDITDLVNEWLDESYNNYGLRMISDIEGLYRRNWALRNRRYSSGEYSTYIEITYQDPYASEGDFTSGPIDLTNCPLPGRISWSEVLPAGTSIDIETAVTDYTPLNGTESWENQTNGSVITNWPEDTDGKNLWVRAILATTDPYATPTLESLLIEAESENQCQIKIGLTEAGRMKYPQGPVSIDFTGSLIGENGASVEAFEENFTPTDITPVFNPNDAEYLEIVDIEGEAILTAIVYTGGQSGDHHLEITDIDAESELIHVNELEE